MRAQPFRLGTLAAVALTGLLAASKASAENEPGFEAQAAVVGPLFQHKAPAAPAVPASVAADIGAQPSPSDAISPAGLPTVGKWMLDKEGKVASWLGDLYKGKHFAEPINIIVRVDTADPAEAKAKLLHATRAAGFIDQPGHSSGYQAWIESTLAKEYPPQAEHAFSDGPFLLPNDHGRLFGPVLWGGRATS